MLEILYVPPLFRLHMVRLMLLERLLQHLPQLHCVGGVRAIPYMQVILMLTADLDGEDEKDKGALDDLLAQLIGELGMHKKVRSRYFFFIYIECWNQRYNRALIYPN